MRRAWPASALDLQATVRTVLAGHGGVDLARSAEAKPSVRTDVLLPSLTSLGVLNLDPLGDEEESSAAALAVRACGEAIAPWPLSRVLALPVPLREQRAGMYVVDGAVDHLEHVDVLGDSVAVSLTRPHPARSVCPSGQGRVAPLDPFGTPVALQEPLDSVIPERAVFMSLVLDAFWVAGALATTTNQAAKHAKSRRQFGKPIGRFGEIRWRLADMVVSADGLEELAIYTWFLVHRDRATLADALALRVGLLEAAELVLRNGHQVLGAIGLCEEHDVAVIDRHITPALLRPSTSSRSADLLLDAVNESGFRGTWDVPSRPSTAAD